MANTTISPNMGLPVPTVSVDPGPDWATNIDACLNIVDSHNHTAGQGVPITPDAMNINADLSMGGNNLTAARSVRFNNQSANLAAAADVGCVYEYNGDLWYNNAAGGQVRLTNGLNPAGGAGSIGGLPSGTASVNFSAGTYTFQSATSTPATMNVGPLIIGQPTNTSKNVTIAPNVAQASNYSLALPLALPSTQSYVISDSSGNLSFLYNGSNVRASEGSGTTTLTSTDNFWQIFNLSAARTVKLPSSGITAGMRFVMENVGTFPLTVQSSGSNTVGVVDSLYSKLECIALIDSPSTAANWMVNLSYSQFEYSSGTSYNGGNAPTVTVTAGATLSALIGSYFIPYQTLLGAWRLRGNFKANMTASVTSVTFSINGVVWKNISTFTQAVSCVSNNGSRGFVNPGVATITCDQTASNDEWRVSLDVELDSKPTWAY